MNKSSLASVVEVFATYPEANAVYLCEDGSVFLEERINLAQNYSRENRFGAPRLVTRDEVEAKNKATGKVQQVVDDIKARKDAEAAAAEQAARDAESAAALPTTPGYYADKDGVHWLLNADGTWSWKQTGAAVDRSSNEAMVEFAPFTAIEEPKPQDQGKGKKGNK